MSSEKMKKETPPLHARFEQFALAYFAAFGWDVTNLSLEGRELGYDFLVAKGDTVAPVEVKLYRSRDIARSALEQTIANLYRIGSVSQAFLFTSAMVSDREKGAYEAEYEGLQILDANVITANVAAVAPDLLDELEAILREAYTFDSGGVHPNVDGAGPSPAVRRKKQRPLRGMALCSKIHSIPAGKANFTKFELACTEALQYIFAEDFATWNLQNSTKSELHRFDLIARIASKDDFWNALITDFRTRYVVLNLKTTSPSLVSLKSTQPKSICTQRQCGRPQFSFPAKERIRMLAKQCAVLCEKAESSF